MKRTEKRAQAEQEVYNRMRYFLGTHPEESMRTALDLVKLVVAASKSKTLDLWLSQMRDLTPDYAPGKPVEPKSRKPRKPTTPKAGG